MVRRGFVAAIIAAIGFCLPAKAAVQQTLKLDAIGSDGGTVQVTLALHGVSAGTVGTATATVTYVDTEAAGAPTVTIGPLTATTTVNAGGPLAVPGLTATVTTPSTWALLSGPTITGLANQTHQFNAGLMTLTGDLGEAGAVVTYQLSVPR